MVLAWNALRSNGESFGVFFTIEEELPVGNPFARSGDRNARRIYGPAVVIDLRSEFVCLGTLLRFDEHFLELKNADLHDLRDTDTTRENYVAASHATGIKRSRKRVLLVRTEIVAIALMDDLVDT